MQGNGEGLLIGNHLLFLSERITSKRARGRGPEQCFPTAFRSWFASDFRERRGTELKVALDPEPERPANTLKLAERCVTQFVAVRPERGAAESEEQKITVRLVSRFQNVEGTYRKGRKTLRQRLDRRRSPASREAEGSLRFPSG